MARAHDDAAVHARLMATMPGYSPQNPLSHWTGMDDPRHELRAGMVLRAKDGDPEDPFYVIRVTGAFGTTRDRIEYGITPYFCFGEIVSAPARGEGGILTHYTVLGESEVAAMLAERETAPAADPDETFVDAARRRLDAIRAEQEGS